jgi:hypothetical protein
MSNKFIPVGKCPNCGAPIVAEKEFWEHGEFTEDELWDALYMKGVIYTCRCYRKTLTYDIPSINFPSVWVPNDYPNTCNSDDNQTEWISPSIPRDTAGNPTT